MVERLIFVHVKPIIDLLLPELQAEFRREKSTVNQVVLLTEKIENFFLDLSVLLIDV